ncbi:MAG: thioredoxin-like domain-containing protein [Anaerolineae bacterium]
MSSVPSEPLSIDLYAEAAPPFPPELEWLNADRPLTMAELRGKIVLLDFWTYGCVSCLHNFPDLQRLQAEYPDVLVLIGVHSAKFTHEAETESIRQVIQRYDLRHPIINDRDLRMWHDWGVQAWPTLVVIDPFGNLAAMHVGENAYAALKPFIHALVQQFEALGRLDHRPLDAGARPNAAPPTVLSFPGKMLADPEGRRLFIADTAHHRVLIADIDTFEVLNVIGRGQAGLEDGAFAQAALRFPQGLALSPGGRMLYIADTGNHVIREADLEAGLISTLAGTGRRARAYPPQPGIAHEVDLASPWDLAAEGDTLYIAMAGSHQIWALSLSSLTLNPVAGSGVEGTADGPAPVAQLAQPSGIALSGDGRLFIADTESSAIRFVDLRAEPREVHHLAGPDYSLFAFGDEDGVGASARFQHPMGLAIEGGQLYVADTYNHKIRRVNLATGEVTTWLGAEVGWRDGEQPLFNEPQGLSIADDKMYMADTNNHAVRVVDLTSGGVTTAVLQGLERFPSPSATGAPVEVTLPPQRVRPGQIEAVIHLIPPAGYVLNDQARQFVELSVGGAISAERTAWTGTSTEMPVRVPLEAQPGEGELTLRVVGYYCEAERKAICLLDERRARLHVQVDPQGADAVPITLLLGQ